MCLRYSCNFSCSYCFQDEYGNKDADLKPEIINSFFNYLDTELAGRRKYITIFGGEPLLPGSKREKVISDLLEKAKERNIEISLVTNGYHLEHYVPILKKGVIREIQVTLDGTEKFHDSRRMLKGGKGTFETIVKGVDSALKANLSINLRMVVDKDNIGSLPELAQFSIDRGWTKTSLFKTQIGRNYELHHCQDGASKLMSRVELYEELYKLVEEYPHIKEFHEPVFSVSKFLSENGKMPDPLFDACPGAKTEWAFDYTGNIFACTATVGKPGESLGTFYPEIKLDKKAIEEWEDRDSTSIPECTECSMQLACGGGCASIAKNASGIHNSPDCRPIKTLLELGISHYFNTEE